MFEYNDAVYPARLCLVPQPVWGVNAHGSGSIRRRLLSEADWKNITRKYRRRHKHCEICGPVSARAGFLYCHEDWGYTLSHGRPVAVMRRLQMLCNHCHDMLHGHYETETSVHKRKDIAHWLAEKNRLPLEKMLSYYDIRLQEQEVLARHILTDWIFDVSFFRQEGVIEVCLGVDLQNMAGEPLIAINGLHVPWGGLQSSISCSVVDDGQAKEADAGAEIIPSATWGFTRMTGYAAMLAVILGLAYIYSTRAPDDADAIASLVSPPLNAGVPSEMVRKPERPAQAKPASVQRTGHRRKICPTGTVRVIAIGPDQLCCDASGTCNP